LNAILGFLASLLAEVFRSAWKTPAETARVTHGNTVVPATDIERVRARAKTAGLLGLLVAILGGCGHTEIVVATLHPVEDATKGWPRVAQDSVTVVLDGTETIGTVAPAGGYFLIHETDLRALLKR
jgi:hypothetical protein